MKHLIRQRLLIGAAAALVFAMAAIAAMRPVEQRTEPLEMPPQRPFAHAVAGTGLIEPASENVEIGTPFPGLVQKVAVQVGQPVRAGDLLFELDTRQLASDLAVQEAAERTAGARLATQRELIADIDDQLTRIRRLDARAVVSTDERQRLEFARRTAAARLAEAEAELVAAAARSAAVRTEIERSRIRAPMDGTVLRVDVRNGEFASNDSEPLVVLGDIESLHVRVDIDEVDAIRVDPAARAVALPRGSAGSEIPLDFVRFEPLVLPKRSLTGSATERVDTRVLQCIYRIQPSQTPLFVGQQMDVYIERPAVATR